MFGSSLNLIGQLAATMIGIMFAIIPKPMVLSRNNKSWI